MDRFSVRSLSGIARLERAHVQGFQKGTSSSTHRVRLGSTAMGPRALRPLLTIVRATPLLSLCVSVSVCLSRACKKCRYPHLTRHLSLLGKLGFGISQGGPRGRCELFFCFHHGLLERRHVVDRFCTGRPTEYGRAICMTDYFFICFYFNISRPT